MLICANSMTPTISRQIICLKSRVMSKEFEFLGWEADTSGAIIPSATLVLPSRGVNEGGLGSWQKRNCGAKWASNSIDRLAQPFTTRQGRMKRLGIISMGVALWAAAVGVASAQTPSRQEVVAERGADVMPFSLKATTHVFTKTQTGGVQKVIAKNPADAEQVRLTREHLKDIADRFAKGDFSGPSHIHGADMPGLVELQKTERRDIAIRYADVPAGAEVTYTTKDARLVAALHTWFDAQLSDHGSDSMPGHDHAKHHMH